MDKVSIILPAYNVESYLPKTLTSLLEQTHQDLEILVVDDCSKDRTRQVIQDFARKDARIVPILLDKNGGVSNARNTALDAMTGDWVCFCDGDDWYESAFVEKMLVCAKSEQADYIICDYQIASDHKQPIKANTVDGLCSGCDPKTVIALGSLSSCTHMFSSALFRRAGLRYPTECRQFEELPVIPALAKYAVRIGIVDEPLYNYYQRGDGSSASNRATDYKENFRKAFSKLTDILGSEYEKELEYHAIYALHYGEILTLCKQGANRKTVVKAIRDNKQKYPGYLKNPYLQKMGMFKRAFLWAENFQMVFVLRLFAKLHSKLVN